MSDSEKESDLEPSSAASTGSVPLLLPDDSDTPSGELYKYRDFSSVAEDEDDMSETGSCTNASSRNSTESSVRVQKFPVKLYVILNQREFHDIISWMPHGRAWKVLKPNLFETMVMPLFFEYSNYHSFNRLVNAWSFRRISSGPDRGSYYHELFLRGKPYLQKHMRRLPKTHKKQPMKKNDEPNFYELDKKKPLPSLEEAPVPGATAPSTAINHQHQSKPYHGHDGLRNFPSVAKAPQSHPHQAMNGVSRGGAGPPVYHDHMYPDGFAGDEYEYDKMMPPQMQFSRRPPQSNHSMMPPPNMGQPTSGFGRPMPMHGGSNMQNSHMPNLHSHMREPDPRMPSYYRQTGMEPMERMERGTSENVPDQRFLPDQGMERQYPREYNMSFDPGMHGDPEMYINTPTQGAMGVRREPYNCGMDHGPPQRDQFYHFHQAKQMNYMQRMPNQQNQLQQPYERQMSGGGGHPPTGRQDEYSIARHPHGEAPLSQC